MNDIRDLHAHLKLRMARDGVRPMGIVPQPPDGARRARSLRHGHLPKEQKPAILWRPDNGRYIPELSAAIDDDPNLCDGARRCARKIAEYAFRHSRDARAPALTVSYLARALRRCRRTVQRYLRALEQAGYISVEVLISSRSGLCIGLAVRLAQRCFPKHHAEKWPDRAVNAGVTRMSVNQRFRYIKRPIPLQSWAHRCMDGVWQAHLRTLQLRAASSFALPS